MRKDIEALVYNTTIPAAGNGQTANIQGQLPDHFGLAYGSWAPSDATAKHAGKVPAERGANKDFRSQWLDKLENIAIHPHYETALTRWKSTFAQDQSELFVVELNSRLLIGHGTSSATEVGLTVHHTWGAPMIPGSALKGICAHYVSTQFGGNTEDRTPYRGVVWDGARMETAPGDVHKALFGAPDSDDAGLAAGGKIIFHDAWYVWDGTVTKPFLADIMTVHQRGYYGQDGGPAERRWANDYDNPNPIGFMTIRPGTKFCVALSAANSHDPKTAEWLALARYFLTEAVSAWGVGGKTAAGYGQLAMQS